MPPDPILSATAIEAVLAAGRIQLARFERGIRIDKKGRIDLVTEVDLEVERMVRTLVAERFPGHRVLAEEFRASGDDTRGGYCWILDPLDGTTNYAHGLSCFCSTLALEIDGRLELGAVYDPVRRELFTAERGQGARLNGQPLRVSRVETLIDAMLVTGFPYDVHETLDDLVGLFSAFLERAQAVRRLGSAALDLCYVAAGRMDGFWEKRLKPWDMAAGALIIEEAGGRVSGVDGACFDCRAGHILGTNGRLHEEMLAVIALHNLSRSPMRTD